MNNHYFFLQSGQHVELGKGELRSLIMSYQPNARIKNLNSRVILAEGELSIEKIITRSAYTKFAGKLLQVSSKINGFDLDGMMKNYRRFACKLINLSKKRICLQVLSDLGDYVKAQAPWLEVSLEDPDVTVLLIKTETESVVGLVENKRATPLKHESRRNRPYFHPVALEPKLCKAMINLAMVKEGNTILDPFCGTGSMMLEADRMHINAIGCDLSERMCKGALKNLQDAENRFIINCDALSLPLKMNSIDAIVTDLPYGRAASALRRKPRELLNEFLTIVKEMKGKRCCIMCRKGDEQEFPNIVETYDIYTHKSLTRKLMVVCN